MSDLYDTLDDFSLRQSIKNLSLIKQRICISLVNGDNLHQISRREGIKTNKIYKIRDEIKEDLTWLKNQHNGLDSKTVEDELFEKLIVTVSKMKLSKFVDLYLNGYNDFCYSSVKQWEKNKQVKDRNMVVISIIIRELFVRSKPIVIDYYYDERTTLVKLIQQFKIIVKSSPIIHDRLNVLHTDAYLGIRLKDGSRLRTIWTKGRQPAEAGSLLIFDNNILVKGELSPKLTYL